ncbi:RCC1 repeat-containing protein, partial [Myxococcota bacterium]|nr:RCC1 repeat-containing protein [Myxococcota bacterium]
AIHSCALLSAGTVKCWGANGDGQLGNGAANTDEVTPVDVSGLSDVAAIVAGYHHNCALLNSGAVKCWGDNYSGQLGDGGTNPLESTPVDVSGLANVIAITAGGSHSCALLDTGAVKCWGSDYYGQLGDSGYNTDSTTPVDVVGLSGTVTAITAGFVHTCALLDTGAMKCWGGNDYGQLGNGEVLLEEISPGNVAGIASGVTAIAAGEHHSCALFNTGAMKCWGNDNYGQLGDNPCRDYSCDVPVDVVGLP